MTLDKAKVLNPGTVLYEVDRQNNHVDVRKLGEYIGNNVVGINVFVKYPKGRIQLPASLRKRLRWARDIFVPEQKGTTRVPVNLESLTLLAERKYQKKIF